MNTVDWLRPMDEYCERLGPGLLAEPLNFTTNLLYIVFGIYFLYAFRTRDFVSGRKAFFYLCFLITSIGIGSGLYHSFATFWSMLADVIPIAVFLFSFIVVNVVFRWKKSYLFAVGALVAFLAVTALLSILFKGKVNGSENYFGTAATLLCLGLTEKVWGSPDVRRALSSSWYYSMASLALITALIFRSIDMYTCPSIVIGTHFLWHIFNSFAILFAMLGLGGRLVKVEPSDLADN